VKYLISVIGIEETRVMTGLTRRFVEITVNAVKSGKFPLMLPIILDMGFLPEPINRSLSSAAAKRGVLEYFDWIIEKDFELQPKWIMKKALRKSQWKVINFIFSKFSSLRGELKGGKKLFIAAMRSMDPKVLKFYFEELGLKLPMEKKPNGLFRKYIEAIENESQPYREVLRILQSHGLILNQDVNEKSLLDNTYYSWIKTDSFLRFLTEDCKVKLNSIDMLHLAKYGSCSVLKWLHDSAFNLRSPDDFLKAVLGNCQVQAVKYSLSVLSPPNDGINKTQVLEIIGKGHVGLLEVIHAFNPELFEALAEGLSDILQKGFFDRLGGFRMWWWDPLNWLNANGYVRNKDKLFSTFYHRYILSITYTHHFLEWLLRNKVELSHEILTLISNDAVDSKRAQFVLKLIKELRYFS
jgi:hypothetical protein